MLKNLKRKIGLAMNIICPNTLSSKYNMDKVLIAYTKYVKNNNQKVTILIIPQKIFGLSPLFKCGRNVPHFMDLEKSVPSWIETMV